MSVGVLVPKPGGAKKENEGLTMHFILRYTTPLPSTDITSLHPPLLFLIVGRGTETDPGEPLLWQLPSEWWAEGQPDVICQWPPQSGRTRQKPIRYDSVLLASNLEHRRLPLMNES